MSGRILYSQTRYFRETPQSRRTPFSRTGALISLLSGFSTRPVNRTSDQGAGATAPPSAARTGMHAASTRNAHDASPGARRAAAASSSETSSRRGSVPSRIRIVRRVLLGLLVTVGAVIAGEVTFQTLLAPNLAIRRVRVGGDSVLSEAEIADIAGLGGTMLYFHIDTEAIARRIERVPEIHSVRVAREFPDTLTIDMTARRPLATTTLTDEGRTVAAVIDREAVVFRTGLQSHEHDLPVISGLQLERFEAGDALPGELHTLFEELRGLRMNEPELYALISEIRIVRRSGRYESIFYPVHARVPVRMPARVDPARYQSALEALEVLSQQGELANVRHIDLRGSDVVYTMREQE